MSLGDLQSSTINTRSPVGTLAQQLLAVEYYLRVPSDQVERIGKSKVWEHCQARALANGTEAPIDEDFRQAVCALIRANREIRFCSSRDRANAVAVYRELEDAIVEELKRSGFSI